MGLEKNWDVEAGEERDRDGFKGKFSYDVFDALLAQSVSVRIIESLKRSDLA